MSPYRETFPFRNGNALHADLIGGDMATALDITANSSSPVISLCKKLIEAGFDPTSPLECWRGDVLCVRIRSIGETAEFEINSHGSGFIRRRDRRRAGLLVDFGGGQ